jgi:hypothetical protein
MGRSCLIKSVLTVVLIGACLFGNAFLASTYNRAIDEVLSYIRDSQTQWTVVLWLAIWILGLFCLDFWRESSSWKNNRSKLLLIAGVFLVLLFYWSKYSASAQLLAFLGGIVVGQGIGCLRNFQSWRRNSAPAQNWNWVVILVLVCLLALGSFGKLDTIYHFRYWGNDRWSGPWDNPNEAGLLMGTGCVLAVGSLAQRRNAAFGGVLMVAFFCMAAALMGTKLLRSFSRGAWIGTICGLFYLFVQKSRNSRRKRLISCLAAILSAALICFWQFRWTEWPLARRALSLVNAYDFSLSNRVFGWKGALQIIAEDPWGGAGWGKADLTYEYYYVPIRLAEGGAIDTNDYLMLTAMAGIPAAFCFALYGWLSITRNWMENVEYERAGNTFGARGPDNGAILPRHPDGEDWLQPTIRSGTLVMLIGFGVDGGLLKLPTAAVFWILLELGRNNQ